MKYGIDTFSRYVEDDKGEKFAVEPYPYRNLWRKLWARWDILRWHIGMIRQDGFAEWNKLRKY